MPRLLELRPVRPTPVETALPRLRSFVSPYTGVIRSLGETLAAPDEHRLISIGCQLADAVPTIGESMGSYTGSEHPVREAAEAAAIGEALERYAGSFVPEHELLLRHRRRSSAPTPSTPRASRSSPTSSTRARRFPSARFAGTRWSVGSRD